MKPGLAYIHQFKNIEGKTVTTTIYDMSYLVPDDNDTQLVTLPAAGDPLHLSTSGSKEEKFAALKAKILTIKFNSTPSENLSTFADGPDDRFKVVTNIEEGFSSQEMFQGFLVLDDNSEAFLPPTNVVTLTATDKLGALKDIPWTEDDGTFPVGKYKLSTIIAQCLKKTGLSLAIKCVNNLRHGSGQMQYQALFSTASNTVVVSTDSGFFYDGMEITTTGTASNNSTDVVNLVEDGAGVKILHLDRTITVAEAGVTTTFTDTSSQKHFYDAIYLYAHSFEAEIGKMMSCYEILERILGEDCFLTQWQGQWWIMRVDEFDGNPPYVASFDVDGVFLTFDGASNFNKDIGATEDIFFSDEQTIVTLQREHGFVKETYRYDNPQENPCNSDFSRGTGTGPTPTQSGDLDYDPECWTLLREGVTGTNASIDTAPVSGSVGIIRKTYELGYEKERKLLLMNAASGGRHYMKSAGIDVKAKSTLDISFDTRFDTNLGIANVFPALIRLEGDDGSMWDWQYNEADGTNQWEEVFSGTGSFAHTWQYNRVADDTTEWRGIGTESKEIPVNGTVYIRLVMGSVQPNEIWFNNLRVTYNAFINGSRQKYSGQFSKVDRTDTQNSGVITTSKYLAVRDEQVYISDSPEKMFKGAMMFFNGTRYILALKYFTSHAFGQSYPPGPEYCIPYGQTQAFAVFNQYRNANRIFQYKFQGDKTAQGFGNLPPDLLNKYFITDNNIHSNNRHFMLLTFDHDLFLCESTGTMAETYRTDLGKLYGDVFSFKYISENA